MTPMCRIRLGIRVGLATVVIVAFLDGSSSAQDPDAWIGKRVIIKPWAPLRDGDRILIQKLEYTARGTRRRSARIFRVKQVNDGRFWVEQEGSGAVGWVEAEAVVPYEQWVAALSYLGVHNYGDHMKRSLLWMEDGKYDNALADLNHAIWLFRQGQTVWANRGNLWRAKKRYEWAILDYDEAIRIEPKYVDAHYNRAVTRMILRQIDSTTGFKAVIDLEQGQGDYTPHAVILGNIAARQGGNQAEAQAFLDSVPRLLPDLWPAPVVRFLRGELDEEGLLALTKDDDSLTEARSILGLDHLLKGRRLEALTQFRWVRDNGVPAVTEFDLAIAELDRLGEPSTRNPTPSERAISLTR
jgi:tetratricopeptide (TPR) repeat protein